jgi:hypothetical protein
MTMRVEYQVSPRQIEDMSVTVELTMTAKEWRELRAAINESLSQPQHTGVLWQLGSVVQRTIDALDAKLHARVSVDPWATKEDPLDKPFSA